MKKKALNISKVFAKFVFHTAKEGAGLASRLGMHQPKVPKRLAK